MFFGLVTALALLLGAIFLLHFYLDYRAESTRRKTDETLNVELGRAALAADIASVTTDLMFLGRLLESLSFEPAVTEGRRRFLAQVFMTFAREKGLYDQIRFLDTAGHEAVRVNLAGGAPVLVGAEALQDKSHRYYVRQALSLDHGQVYISPLDLNVEGGEVEQPVKPVLRFATAVFDASGERRGIVVLNYLGERLLDRFRQAAANIGDHVQLLNGDGYWLSSPRAGDTWGFMFGREDTFARRFPAAWRRIRDEPEGQFVEANSLFTFATVLPAAEAADALEPGRVPTVDGSAWKVVSQLPLDIASLGLAAFVSRYASLYLGIGSLLAILAYLLASANVHRRAAEAQRAYERKFRQTLEDIELAALMVDTKGRVTFCNPYLLQVGGWRPEEVIGTDWVKRFVPRDQRAAAKAVLRRISAQGHVPARFEGDLFTSRGERRQMLWNNTLARDGNGRVVGLTAIGEDVTERRRAEEQVRKLSEAVEQSPTIVVITDLGGRIEYVNSKFCEVTGYRYVDVIGRNPRLLKSGETPSSEYEKLWRALTSGGEWRGEFHNRRKDGSLYWESALISALRDAEGRITHYLAVKEDITERKRLEQEVAARNLELARAQALAAMGQMSTMLAHDLRNPLSSIKMAVQILGKQANGPEALELSAIGQEQIRYMEDIISDMLAYSRPGTLKMTWVSADKQVASVVETVRRRMNEYGVSLRVDCEKGLPTFPADQTKLRQLLANLLVNAFQAVAENAENDRRVSVDVAMAMQAGTRHIRFRICDNGPGVDQADHRKLFEPFHTTRAKGTGLGLAIVKQIADLHDGTVDFESNAPRGACAVLTLPVVPASRDAEPGDVSGREAIG